MRLSRLNWAAAPVLLAVLSVACTQAVAAADATQPLSQKSSVDEILDALDASGKSMSDLSADLKQTDESTATGDQTIYDGKLLLQRKGTDDARVKIIYTGKESGNNLFAMDHRYVLDNGKLTERDYLKKIESTRELLKPGEKLNLLKLGEGPFPLPIGQKKEDVKAQFDVSKIDPATDDPAGAIHLQLIPKPDSTLARRFKTLDVWVDTASALPSRIQTLDPNETTTKTTDLAHVKLNSGLQDKDFIEPDLPAGWETHDEPYED